MNPANSQLKYSAQGLELTEQFEGVRLEAYLCPAGKPTVGYGHTGPDVHLGLVITQEHAIALLQEDVIWAETAVKNHVQVPLDQDEFDGLCDLVFNIGVGNFTKSSVLRFLNAKNYMKSAEAFMLWDRVAGVENKGLARRRLAEKTLFEHGIVSQ